MLMCLRISNKKLGAITNCSMNLIEEVEDQLTKQFRMTSYSSL